MFFALWPQQALAGRLAHMATAAAAPGRLMRQESLHLTLAFIGQVTASQLALLMRCGAQLAVPGFTLQLDRLNYWPHNQILWAGCSQVPTGLLQLVQQLHGALHTAGFVLDERAFVPHVTLARKVPLPPAPDAWARHAAESACSWPVREFVLAASRPAGGGQYELLARWPCRALLGGPAGRQQLSELCRR